MTNNTIPNVPRELLADALGNDHDKRIMAERHLLAMLANAPSPAGVDGLEVVATLLIDDPTDQECGDWDIEVESKVAERMSEHGGGQHELCRLSDAKAIIDGLRGELAVALKVPSVAAMHAYLDTECAKDNMRLGSERDQHAQRIGELEGLLRSCLPALSDGGCAALANRIDAALSAGKEGE